MRKVSRRKLRAFGEKTDGRVEDINSVGSVIIQSFVYNIPAVALALIMRDLVRNMVLHGSNESRISPRARSYCNYQPEFPNFWIRAYPSLAIHYTTPGCDI